ncbi:hypothetical protein [Stutzerimonas nitrititolerans]|uniref:hypothetical protein n=1 Tax=Stutzerimonas nitrititolerans TaxID=2482751 RepID=UPI00289B6344|nr:hypothetical protein [Stutzerimonas nitrititolerans]
MAMSNEASRRASGAAMEASRRAGGAAMEASRRAGGAAMEERRRGKQLVDDINSLANPPANRKTLRTVDPFGGVPARRGSGVYQAPAAAGGGIASPLTEVADSRVYYTEEQSQYIYSQDYLLSMEVLPLKSLFMTDATGAAVQMNFALPVREEP